MIDYTRLRKKLNPDSRLGGDPGLELRTGIVTAVGTGTATITLGGSSVANVPVLDGAIVAIGLSVQVLSYRGSLLIIGAVHGVDASGWVAGDGITSSTTATTTETAGITTTSFIPRANCAYKAEFTGSVAFATASTDVLLRVRKTNTSGQQINVARLGARTGTLNPSYDLSWSCIFRVGSSDLSSAAMCLTYMGQGGNGSISAAATSCAAFNVYYIGPASRHTYAPTLT